MVKIHGGIYTVLLVLLNKQRSTYIRLFDILKKTQPNLDLKNINCDYKISAISAVFSSFTKKTQILYYY